MPDLILVPLDGSALAERAVPWANHLAGALRARVELLHVLPLDTRLEALEAEVELNRRFMMPGRPEEAEVERRFAEQLEAAMARARRVLDAVRGALPDAIDVETTVLRGDPAEVIVSHAAERGARMIIMATHAREGIARALLGSVAGAVLERSGIPVMLLNPTLETPPRVPRRVLVPLDGSPLADAVLPVVLPLAQELGSSLILFTVTVLPPPTLPVQGASIPLGPPLPYSPAEVAQHLETVAAEARSRGIAAEIAVGSGDRAESIVRAAVERECDLIAMSTHGRHGLGRWLVGSVTERVVRTSEVPVLAICPPEIHAARSASQATAVGP